MATHGKMLVSALVLLLATGCAGPWLGASGPCAGIDQYGNRILGAVAPYKEFAAEIDLNDRILSLSSSEWVDMADQLAGLQARMKGIEPPSGLAEWHQHEISSLGLVSTMARTMATGGLFAGAAIAQSEEGRRLEDEGRIVHSQAVANCPDFAPIHDEWDKVAG